MGKLNLGRVILGLWPEMLRRPAGAVLLWGWVFVFCGIRVALTGLLVYAGLAAVVQWRRRKRLQIAAADGADSGMRLKMRCAYGLAGLGLVLALFILRGRDSFAKGFREVETLTRSGEFRESFLGDRVCKRDRPFLSSFGPGAWAKAIVTLGPKRFVCWEQLDLVLYADDASEIARKPLFEFLPEPLLWRPLRVCYSDAETVWFIAGKKHSDEAFYAHGVLKVSVGDAEISGKTYEIDRFSSVAVDAPRDRVFVFRDLDLQCVDVYNMNFSERVRSPLATRYDSFFARCGPSGRFIYLDAMGPGLGKGGSVLFNCEEKKIVGRIGGQASGWMSDGRILVVRGGTLGMYDPDTGRHEKIFECGVLSHSIRAAVGADGSFLRFSFVSWSALSGRADHEIWVDVREKDYVRQRRTAQEEEIL